jgi:hypothetical protein
MRFVPNAVSSTVSRQLLHAQKHSPAIMFGAGIAFAVVATVKACQATLKVDEVIKEAEKDRAEMQTIQTAQPERYTLEAYKHDQRVVRVKLARDLTKLYAPAVVFGAGSIALLTGAHVVLTKRNVALTAAYVGLDRVFNEYRTRVREELGDEKDREFRYGAKLKEIVEETDKGHEVKSVKRVGEPGKRSQYAVLFDQNNKNWQPQAEYNRTFIMLQQCWANERLRAKGHLFLNDVYEALGMDPTPAGQIVGWVVGGNMKTTAGDGYVDFGLFNPKTQEIYDFMQGEEGSVWLDFNVDGPVWDLI